VDLSEDGKVASYDVAPLSVLNDLSVMREGWRNGSRRTPALRWLGLRPHPGRSFTGALWQPKGTAPAAWFVSSVC